MTKSADAFRTISEVAEVLDTPAHVLRFWESRFPQIKPVKRAGGRRYYRPADVALLGGIKALLHDDGLTIRGVQKLLKDLGPRHVAAMAEGVEASINDLGAPESLDQAEHRDGPQARPDESLPPSTLPPTTVEALNGTDSGPAASKPPAKTAEVRAAAPEIAAPKTAEPEATAAVEAAGGSSAVTAAVAAAKAARNASHTAHSLDAPESADSATQDTEANAAEDSTEEAAEGGTEEAADAAFLAASALCAPAQSAPQSAPELTGESQTAQSEIADKVAPAASQDLTEADLTGPDLTGSDLVGPALAGPDLVGPDLAGPAHTNSAQPPQFDAQDDEAPMMIDAEEELLEAEVIAFNAPAKPRRAAPKAQLDLFGAADMVPPTRPAEQSREARSASLAAKTKALRRLHPRDLSPADHALAGDLFARAEALHRVLAPRAKGQSTPV